MNVLKQTDNGRFQHVPQRPRSNYLKIKKMEEHKDFILRKLGAGVKQKHILGALKSERGVDLAPYKLKRLLDKWKISKQNLTKKGELYIRNEIEQRRHLGKEAHRATLTRSGRELTEEEMDAIMSATPRYFKGVKLNSETGIIISTPTPKAGCEVVQEADLECSYDMEMEIEFMDRSSPRSDLPTEVMTDTIDSESDCDIGGDDSACLEDEYGEINNNSDGWGREVEEGGVADPEENIGIVENTIKVYMGLGLKNKDALIAAIQENPIPPEEPDDAVEELQEILKSGLESMVPVEAPTEWSDNHASSIQLSDDERRDLRHDFDEAAVDSADEFQHETPLARYARQRRYLFWERVNAWKDEARSYLEEVRSVSEERGVSEAEAAEIVSREYELSDRREPLPYQVYQHILEQDGGTMSTSRPTTVEGVDADLLCRIMEDSFPGLEEAFTQFPSSSQRADFDGYAVHLPFVISEFGLSHFFTARTLDCTFTVFYYCKTAVDLRGDRIAASRLRETLRVSALCVYLSVGMGAHELVLKRIDWDDTAGLEPKLALAYAKVRDGILKMTALKYGWGHHKTLRLYCRLALRLFDSPINRHRGESMAYGIYHTMKACYPVYQCCLKDSIKIAVEMIASILLRSGRAALAVALLAEPATWEGKPGVLLSGHPSWSCNNMIGRAYADLGRYKESLAALFSCWNGYRDEHSLHHEHSLYQIRQITNVMDRRGPVLYNYLDSTFDGLLNSLKAAGKAKGQAYELLYRTRKRGGYDVKPFIEILAAKSADRSRAPESYGLTDYMFEEGLKCWLYHLDVPLEATEGGGGFVEEISPLADEEV